MQHFGGRDSKSERELMASVRYDRINEEIKKALSEIVREMKDPRISPMTTIMLVEATNDLKLAKVRVSVYDKDDSVRKETVAQLNRAEGFIARELGRRIDIRRIPTLKFTLDDSIEYSVHISEIINKLQTERAQLDANRNNAEEDKENTQNVLEMSNLQAVPRDDCIELAPLADEIVTDLTPLAQKKQITLHQECEDIHIIGSDALIYRMLFNLVENAIKYNQPGGSVQITISRSNGKAILRVADTGCGIPDEYRTSIFEPFFRVDKSRSREMGGAGLGLALVREIAALHGGTVQDEPAEGAGTVFTVALPM